MSGRGGELKDKALLAAAQEIQQGFLTGVLSIKADGEALEVHIRQGRILQVDSSTRPPEWRIGQLLTRGDYFLGVELATAQQEARAAGLPLGALLLKQQKVDPVHLAELLHVQFLEDLHRAAALGKGSWSFVEQEVKKRPAAPPPLNLVDVVEAGMGHQLLWGALEAAVPSDSATWEKTHEGPVSPELARATGLGKRELRVFGLIHPSRDVMALVSLARLERFEVYRALAMLTQARLVALKDPGRPQRRRSAVNARALGRGLVNHAMTAALMVGALLLGVAVFLNLRAGDGDEAARDLDPWREAQTRAQIERISNALGAYRAREGDYPVSLPLLVQEGLLTQEDLTFPDFEGPYVYRLAGERFVLVRPKR
jgi:hypothetical protein